MLIEKESWLVNIVFWDKERRRECHQEKAHKKPITLYKSRINELPMKCGYCGTYYKKRI